MTLQQYSLNFYLRQSWTDIRLAYRHLNGPPHEFIKLDQEVIDSIWKPDTFFRNEKTANYHGITQPNRLVRVNENGSVWYVTK